ncbi:MAG: thioredoxin domain-containing protein, partial [Pseudomonadota bacterium]|nr:thioredoxin domain-containing protein [Pseudomonadota bacterium]
RSLDAMALRGLWDHIGEGFFRYTVDAHWRIPHFEKMLYDNAQLLALYSEAATAFQEPLYRDRALGIVRWAMRELCNPGGEFYASLDADSGGEEGAYYLWSRQDVETALPQRLWTWCAPAWGLNAAPNFEDRAWHLQLQAPIGVLARELALPPDKLVASLLEARNILRPLRDQRPSVQRDEKILTAWNGLMISALALTARKLGAPELAEMALNGLRALRADVWHDGRLLAVHAGGDAYLPAYLDDYAFLADAALAVSEACGSAEALHWAIEWAEDLINHFQDIENGGFFFTAHDHETLIHRPKPFADEAAPAGNAVATRALQRLGWILAEPRYLAAAESTLQAGAESMRRMPHAHASLALALQEFLHPPTLIVLRGAAPTVRDWQRRIQTAETSAVMIFAVSDPAGDWPDVLAAKPVQGDVCAYLCRGTQCEEAPYHDLAALLDRLTATSKDCATPGCV